MYFINDTEILNMIHPGMILILFGVIAANLPKPCRRLISVLAPVFAFWTFTRMSGESSLGYDITPLIRLEFIHFDSLAYTFMLLFCVTAVINGIYGEGIQGRLECGMSLVYAGSIMGIILAGDCISLLFFWEISAAASMYIIYCRHDSFSAGASFRYIFIQALGSNLMLAGFIVYIFHYGNSLENLTGIYGEPCFWLIAAGVAISAAVPPLHAWMPDAYAGSTAAGTVYLSAFTVEAAIYVMIRLLAGFEVLVWAGATAAVFGVFMAILENDIRKTLAYTLVSQLGVMTAAAGAGGSEGIDAAAAHAFTTVLSVCALMMGAGIVLYASGRSKITELGGLARRMPVPAICFLISSLAVSDLPGLSGFISKSLAVDVLNGQGFAYPAVLITAAGAGTVLAVTLKINWYVFFGPCSDPVDSETFRKVPFTMFFALMLGSAASVLIGADPDMFFSIMPYQTAADPYQAGNVSAYLAMFAGGAIPFFIFLKKMKPDNGITVDFDWFLKVLLEGITGSVNAREEGYKPYEDNQS